MAALFTKEDGRLEVFPLFQWSPPRRQLGFLNVDRVLVGHGNPIVESAQAVLDGVLTESRREAPSALARSVPTFARIAYHNIRERLAFHTEHQN